MKSRISLGLAAAAILMAAPLHAQTLYKLIDKNGKVTYSEAPPKNFDGKVEKMVIDPNANTATLPKMPPPPPAMDAGPGTSAEGRAKTVTKADSVEDKRARLEAAKKAYQDAVDNPKDGEITRVGNVNGMTRPVPSEEYTRRLAGLEAAVKAAEEDLRRAEGG